MTIATVLLDLDDTLLNTRTDAFISRYLKALGQALSQYLPADKAISAVLAASKKMQENLNPDLSNYEVFYEAFWPYTNGAQAEVQAVIDRFYEETYPTLRQYVEPVAVARPLVAYLHATGYRVVIATNPLFPATAIKQRIDWAGVLDFPHALITTMDNMHFCKPAPQYYQEIMARTGSLPAQTMMVGDDLLNDIAPAQSVGMRTWWVTEEAHPPVGAVTDYSGSLEAFYRQVQEGMLENPS